MKNKPSWGFWLAWLLFYIALDLLFERVLHGAFAWAQLPGAFEDSLFGATATWLFALWKWHKADSGL